MADVEVTIGGDATPFKAAMLQAQTYAKESGAKIGESLGLEGLKGERGLKTQVSGFFKDIAAGADPATAAMGRLQDSFRMTGGAVVASVAIGYLVETLSKGWEAAGKLKEAVTDALTIKNDVSAKSIEQIGEEIAKLKEDAKATDLGSMTGLEAGATVVMESLREMKSVGETVKDDILAHAEIAAKLHAEEDAAASRTISEQNEILQLRLDGDTQAAEMRADELADANKLLELERQKDEGAIAALTEQVRLKAELRDKQEKDKGAKALGEVENKARNKIDATNKEADGAEKKAAFEALFLPDKIATLMKRVTDAEQLKKNPNVGSQQQADLRLVIAQTKEQLGPLQKEQARETDEKGAKREELTGRQTKLQAEQAGLQNSARVQREEAMGFHGQTDSLRREGFAGRAGPNENGSQLKELAQSNAHLKKVSDEISALNKKLKVL